MERVKIIKGNSQVIAIAPHGFDDKRTAIFAETVAISTNGYGVINLGWEKSKEVEFMKDKADCNNVKQCHEDVVREEFLEPILRFKNKILKSHNEVYVFYFHGMSNDHRVLANDPTMDIVLGFGTENSGMTFDIWKRNYFLNRLENAGFSAYESAGEGPMSGASKNNMNQLFRKWYPDERVNSLQIEVIYELRSSDIIAKRAASYIGEAILETITSKKFSVKINKKVY